jgi:hypothetical protein
MKTSGNRMEAVDHFASCMFGLTNYVCRPALMNAVVVCVAVQVPRCAVTALGARKCRNRSAI